MGIRADLELAPVLALIHVGVNVTDDRVPDLPHRLGENGDRPNIDHLVDGGRQRDRGPRHPGDPRTPHPACHDDHLCLNIALRGSHATDAAV